MSVSRVGRSHTELSLLESLVHCCLGLVQIPRFWHEYRHILEVSSLSRSSVELRAGLCQQLFERVDQFWVFLLLWRYRHNQSLVSIIDERNVTPGQGQPKEGKPTSSQHCCTYSYAPILGITLSSMSYLHGDETRGADIRDLNVASILRKTPVIS